MALWDHLYQKIVVEAKNVTKYHVAWDNVVNAENFKYKSSALGDYQLETCRHCDDDFNHYGGSFNGEDL